MLLYFSIISGAVLGAISRHFVSKWLINIYILTIPISILSINILGSFLMGIIFQITQQSEIDENVKLFITTGFLSSFTTFSTFTLEAYNLIKEDKIIFAFLYILISVVISLLFLYLGVLLVKRN